MTCRRPIAPTLLLLLTASIAAAQPPTGLARVRIVGADGNAVPQARLELTARDDTQPEATGTGRSGTWVTLVVPGGTYRLRVAAPGHQALDAWVFIDALEVVSLTVSLAADGAAGSSEVRETDRAAGAYQTRFDQRHLDALPHSRSAWSLLETAHPFLVSDRIDAGGLGTGEEPLLGQGSSATQTTFRLDGIDVTDPETTGTPLLYPDVRAFQSVVVGSAGLDASAAGPAPSLDLFLKRPGSTWSGAAEFTAAPRSMQALAGDIAPIARLEEWLDGGAAAGGAAGASPARLFVSGRAAHVTRVEREAPESVEGSVRTATARLGANTGGGNRLDLLAGFSGTTAPLVSRARFADRGLTQSDDSLVLHASWGRRRASGQWWADGGFQRGVRDADVAASQPGGLMERLQDGPPLALLTSAPSTRQRWSLSGRWMPDARRWLAAAHGLDVGVSVAGTSATTRPGAQPAFGELVNGLPARVWDATAGDSRRSATTLSAFVSDHIPVGDALTVTAALRLDLDRAAAEGAPDRIAWTTLLPRASARWRPFRQGAFSITGGYGWYGHRLPLAYLAVGDPAGVSGTMFRWDDRDGDRGWTSRELTPVAAVGLCCAGGEASRIDDGLRRPVTREFRIGGEHTIAGWRVAITGLDRREDHLVALVNTGVTLADYTVSYIDDPGVDIAGLQGYAPLPIFDRRPESALRDRYRLTNTSAPPSRFQSFDLVTEHDFGERWFFRFGGTAYRSEGVGTSRGYRPDENDQGLLGEAFVTPNAQTNARGRLFYDRAFMMKVLGAYTAPRVFRGAFVARYQDGQPFARLVLADGLTQGRDLIQAYGRGGQRFTYTVTLDARVAAEWPLGARQSAALVVEAFNLLNMANEVEEDVVTGPSFRAITAVQPPRVVRLGVRFAF